MRQGLAALGWERGSSVQHRTPEGFMGWWYLSWVFTDESDLLWRRGLAWGWHSWQSWQPQKRYGSWKSQALLEEFKGLNWLEHGVNKVGRGDTRSTNLFTYIEGAMRPKVGGLDEVDQNLRAPNSRSLEQSDRILGTHQFCPHFDGSVSVGHWVGWSLGTDPE